MAGFADATGRFLPLVCTLNAARVLGAAASMLGTDLAGLERLALAAAPGAGGLSLLPYLDGERTPDLPTATGTLGGLTRENATPENLARAAVEGMLCGLADGVDALLAQGAPDPAGAADRRRRPLRGGPADRPRPVRRPGGRPRAPAEYVALGAARQAAWALAGGTGEAPSWPPAEDVVRDPVDPDGSREVRENYRALRLAMHPESG